MSTGILLDPRGGSTRPRATSSIRPWEFIVPDTFDASQLPPRLWGNADEARHLLSTALGKKVSRRTDRDGYARLREAYLRRFVSHRKLVPLERELEQMGVWEIDHSYLPGVYSKGFRLTASSLIANHIRVRPTSPVLVEKLRKRAEEVARTQAARQKPIHRALDRIQNELLTIDGDKARRIMQGADFKPSSRLCQGVIVENLERRTLSSSVSKYGRWFNAITGLSKKLRPCLHLDGEELGAIDLACCQPAILGLAIHANLTPDGWKGVETYKLARALPGPLLRCCATDRVRTGEFLVLVSEGEFYGRLAAETGLSVRDAKRRFLVDVLAPRDYSYPSDVRETFTRLFPGPAALIRGLNAVSHCETIRMLQWMEATLVIETVAPKLVGKIPIVTLHDAIYARMRDLPIVEEAFGEVFDEIGFRIAMKREPKSLPEPEDALLAA